ncbi:MULTISPECIES: hypothetical protein [Nocardia]|uniref:Uncharacterized protein n=1 Tax=Nocardia coubleae TaxID=356147 RepID=A0A846WA73_9NOCA|nr:hypothetical protein [Nocardia coubleae]NKX89586.1 hypothetical protein [Nocardia coubleae]
MTPTPLSAHGLMPVGRPADHRPRLDRLSAAGLATFGARFAAAPEPTAADFARLDGDVSMRSFPGSGERVLAPLMARPSYFWVGKSLRHVGDGVAVGHNVFRLLGGLRALNFVATVGDSVLDGRSAVLFDYDDPRVGSRRPARRIYDELREIEPDLWLGPSYFSTRSRRIPMGWFALDASVPFAGPA